MYPPENFPTFYVQMRQRLLAPNIHFVKPVFDEIEFTREKLEDDDLRTWLKKISDEREGFVITPNGRIYERVNELAAEYPSEREVEKGTSLNDLLLIATAKEYDFTVVSQEAKQENPPKKKANYKIPLVC